MDIVTKQVGDLGTVTWYLGDIFHRTDGPAIVYPDGTQQWYSHGKLHRTDGPAVIFPDGVCIWYFNDVQYESIAQWAVDAGLSDGDLTQLMITYG
jgi:hypothetical protein